MALSPTISHSCLRLSGMAQGPKVNIYSYQAGHSQHLDDLCGAEGKVQISLLGNVTINVFYQVSDKTDVQEKDEPWEECSLVRGMLHVFFFFLYDFFFKKGFSSVCDFRRLSCFLLGTMFTSHSL